MAAKRLAVGTIKVEIHENQKDAGEAAARAAAHVLKQLDRDREEIGVVFATGASQIETLHALTSIEELPGKKFVVST